MPSAMAAFCMSSASSVLDDHALDLFVHVQDLVHREAAKVAGLAAHLAALGPEKLFWHFDPGEIPTHIRQLPAIRMKGLLAALAELAGEALGHHAGRANYRPGTAPRPSQ